MTVTDIHARTSTGWSAGPPRPARILGAHTRSATAGPSSAPCGPRPTAVRAWSSADRAHRSSRCTTAACSRRSSTAGAPTTGSRSATATSRYAVDDPYRWLPTLGEIDLHLIGEGRHENLWDVLGAHVRTYDTPGGPVTGTSFAVWAPNARGRAGDRRLRLLVRAGRCRCARSARPASGSCSCPASATARGTSSRSSAPDGEWREKADPMAFAHRGAAGHRVGRARRPARVDTTSDWLAAAGRDRLARGADVDLRGAPRLVAAWASATASWPTSWSTTCARPASPTSSSCRSPSTRSAAPGATRSPPTTRRPRGSAIRTTSATSSTRCTRPASA